MKQGGGGGGGGSEIDYFVMQTGNVYRQISCVAKQLLPFGLLECDSGSLFNCDLHLKYRNYIHIPHGSMWSLMHQFTLKFSFDVTVIMYIRM